MILATSLTFLAAELGQWAASRILPGAREGWREWAGWISSPHRSRTRTSTRLHQLHCRATRSRPLRSLFRSSWSHLPAPIPWPPLCQKWAAACVITHPTVSISHRSLMRWGNTDDREQPTASYRSTVEVQDFRTIFHHFRGILENTPQISKDKPKDVDMWVVGLETLRSQPIMNKKSPQILGGNIVIWCELTW